MGVREILVEFMKDMDPQVREILSEVVMAEQRKIDMKRPHKILEDIRDVIDRQVRLEERSR